MKTISTKTVMRYVDQYEEQIFVSSYQGQGEDIWRLYATYDADEAMNFDNLDHAELFSVFSAFMEKYGEYVCEVVKITTTVEEEEALNLDDNDIKEIRQKIALKKLNDQDIKALGITNIATYIKTKYHNT